MVVSNDEANVRKGDHWTAFIRSAKEGKVFVSVTSPTYAFVGKYSIIVKLLTRVDGKKQKMAMRKVESPFYMLFNPWNKGARDVTVT